MNDYSMTGLLSAGSVFGKKVDLFSQKKNIFFKITVTDLKKFISVLFDMNFYPKLN